MKIKDILEALKQGKSLADIGKGIAVGKEKLSASLKNAGYKHKRGTGWIFIGEGTEPLDQDYTEFIPTSKSVSGKKNEPSNVPAKEQIKQAREQVASTKEPVTPTKERTNVIRKRSSFDIDVELMKELKIQAILHDRNVYEIVENAIRKELAELKKN